MAITTLNKPCQLVMARGLVFCPTLTVSGMQNRVLRSQESTQYHCHRPMYHLRRIERISHKKIHNSGYGMSYHYITIVICPYYMTLQLPVKAAVFMMNILYISQFSRNLFSPCIHNIGTISPCFSHMTILQTLGTCNIVVFRRPDTNKQNRIRPIHLHIKIWRVSYRYYELLDEIHF